MPLANTTINTLRQRVYPSSKAPTCYLACALLKRQPQLLARCCRFRLQSYGRPVVTVSRNAPYSTRSIYNREWNDQPKKRDPNAGELPDRQCMKELDIDQAYFELRQIALAGDYTQTRACVDILIKERGEEPNARLYDALLLANVDPENGSASEAASILEEMVNEGIAPDAAVCHAVLRVCTMLRQDFSLPQLTFCRSSLYIRTTCCDTTSFKGYAKGGFP